MVKKMLRSLPGLLLLAAFTNAYRLPSTVVPEHYRLEILTYLGDSNPFDYDGKVKIETHCVEAASNITLHSKNLTIIEKEVFVRDITSKDHQEVTIERIDFDLSNDFLILHLKQKLTEGHKYEIFIPFSGVLQDSLTGFYKSSYIDAKSKQKNWLGVTQFEPYYARKAFPCFDEPAMKATFGITIGRKEGYSSVSNMPIVSTMPIEGKSGWFWDKFEISVPMSTYLIAYMVSDFEHKQSEPSKLNNVTFKIWARKDAIDQVNFASEVGPQALEFYEKYFSIPYPLPKQDMVALPDFSAGAMENWGLITYRETALLFDPSISSKSDQHYVASVVAHELAHQWFGNLVTMKWWTDLWLNEGFATYMSSQAVHALFPQWNSLDNDASTNLVNVFDFDSLRSSHPVSVPIGHPSEIDEIFDTISYKKGSFLIRMMGMFLGDETLRNGVSAYLKEHEYGNAEQDDLWESLTKEGHRTKNLPANLTVKMVMDTWTLQTGYPVVNVTRNYDAKTAMVAQERYLKDATRTKEAGACWWVPLSYTDGKELNFTTSKPKTWLSCPGKEQEIGGLPADTWVLFNVKVGGLYRVNYDERNWQLLVKELTDGDFKKIPALNRVQLIEDASELAQTGKLKYDILFELLKYLTNEEEYIPWKTALNKIGVLDRYLRKSPSYGHFRLYFSELLEPIYRKVGGLVVDASKKDQLDAIRFQVSVVRWACKLGVTACRNDAQALFKKLMENAGDETIVPNDLKSAVYCTGIRLGGEDEWNFLWAMYKKSNVATEKIDILRSLGCTQELWILNKYLGMILKKDSKIRNQDIATVFGAVAANNAGFYVAKNFLFANLNNIYQHMGMHSRTLRPFLSSLATQISSRIDYVEFDKFLKENGNVLSENKKSIQQNLEKAKLSVEWQSRHLKDMGGLLRRLVRLTNRAYVDDDDDDV